MASPCHGFRNVSGITAWFRTSFFPFIPWLSMSPDQAFSVLRAFLADERHHRFTLATFDESLARAFVEESDLVQLVH
jgi:hypothetical protein